MKKKKNHQIFLQQLSFKGNSGRLCSVQNLNSGDKRPKNINRLKNKTIYFPDKGNLPRSQSHNSPLYY